MTLLLLSGGKLDIKISPNISFPSAPSVNTRHRLSSQQFRQLITKACETFIEPAVKLAKSDLPHSIFKSKEVLPKMVRAAQLFKSSYKWKMIKERFPVPRLVVCHQYGSQTLFLRGVPRPSPEIGCSITAL